MMKFIHKKSLSIFILVFYIICPSKLNAQQYTSYTLSGFYVPENDFDEQGLIGFTSLTVDSPIQLKNKYELKGGLQFIGATTGIRGGFFALGYKAEGVLNPKNKFQPGLSFSILAGGGGKTHVHDGLIVQGTLFSQYQITQSLKIRAGILYTHASGGIVGGWSPTLGLNFNLRPTISDTLLDNYDFRWKSIQGEAGIGQCTTNRKLAFIGAGVSWEKGKWITGELTAHSLANTYGGYMQILASSGIKIGNNKIQIIPALVLGLGGGGGAEVGGGALVGVQCSSRLQIHNTAIGLKYQKIKAINDIFGYDGLFLSFGANIGGKSSYNLKWYPTVKYYNGHSGFGNIGVRFEVLNKKLFTLSGSTYWACTHNRGAYAEGFFELIIKAPYSIPLYTVASFGAGAGASINKETKSAISGIALGLKSPWKKLPLALEAGYWKGGNIPKTSFSLVYKKNVN